MRNSALGFILLSQTTEIMRVVPVLHMLSEVNQKKKKKADSLLQA